MNKRQARRWATEYCADVLAGLEEPGTLDGVEENDMPKIMAAVEAVVDSLYRRVGIVIVRAPGAGNDKRD